MAEAKSAGIADIVDQALDNEDLLDKELQHLERQQEKLAAELRRAYQAELEAETDENKAALDAEMERRVREMNILNSPKAEEQLLDLKDVGLFIVICPRDKENFN